MGEGFYSKNVIFNSFFIERIKKLFPYKKNIKPIFSYSHPSDAE